MKFILKKNQIIITLLAALIAVAGYLNHIENKEKEPANASVTAESTADSAEAAAEAEGDVESLDVDVDANPGEAVLVNAVGNVDFVVEAKLLREQTRASSKTGLMEIVNNMNLTEAERSAAAVKIEELSDIALREMAAENLISARGYENVVVTVTDDTADVMVVADSLDDTAKAQIEEIVKTKTKVEANKITITAIKTTSEN